MVRAQEDRRAKYKAKTDGTIVGMRVNAYRDTMVTLYTSITALLVQKEEEAKTRVLEPAGVPTSEIPFYLNALREFCKCARNFTSTTRNNKALDILAQYRDKGLRTNLLSQLAALCGCYPPGYEYYW